jgi:hypothetical protein
VRRERRRFQLRDAASFGIPTQCYDLPPVIRVRWEFAVVANPHRPVAVEAALLDAAVEVVEDQATVRHAPDDTTGLSRLDIVLASLF